LHYDVAQSLAWLTCRLQLTGYHVITIS